MFIWEGIKFIWFFTLQLAFCAKFHSIPRQGKSVGKDDWDRMKIGNCIIEMLMKDYELSREDVMQHVVVFVKAFVVPEERHIIDTMVGREENRLLVILSNIFIETLNRGNDPRFVLEALMTVTEP